MGVRRSGGECGVLRGVVVRMGVRRSGVLRGVVVRMGVRWSGGVCGVLRGVERLLCRGAHISGRVLEPLGGQIRFASCACFLAAFDLSCWSFACRCPRSCWLLELLEEPGVGTAADELLGVGTAADELLGVSIAADELPSVSIAADELLGVELLELLVLSVGTAVVELLGLGSAAGVAFCGRIAPECR